MEFLPTGGVSAENVGAWFAAGALAVGVGGALAPSTLEDRPGLVARARELVGAVAEARGA
jgi:2-dehydro-3-deoxyphosphogluconate aldolase/(4S)-4-hydroxy-2-oxoglutarate aldolase